MNLLVRGLLAVVLIPGSAVALLLLLGAIRAHLARWRAEP